jgi:2-polyprenyl-3-methyl-5-hydroxy-6-metoxy-1,4-benzoquinol methylase
MNKVDERETSILTKKRNLEKIFQLSEFPVYAGCVDTPINEDVLLDLNVSICRDTGIIQVDLIPSLDLVYLRPHNDSIGKTWEEHHEEFAKFILKHSMKKVLEIGGGTTKLSTIIHKQKLEIEWTIVDPNMLDNNSNKVNIIKDYFHDTLDIEKNFDAVIHSHTIEHMKDPIKFVSDVGKYLKDDGVQIFTFPNMDEWISRKYLNCINFEHPQLLADSFVDVILENEGFQILEKKLFKDDHSIFYAAKKTKFKKQIEFPKKYDLYKNKYLEFVNYYKEFVSKTNYDLDKFSGNVYIYGAHMFSQYLIAFGIDQKKIIGILDNSELKIGKRLYGTKFDVFHPDIIKNRKNIAIILKVGSYKQEILEQLIKINPHIKIFE